MNKKKSKTLSQKITWWWNTRVLGFFRYKLRSASIRNQSLQSGTIQFKRDGKELKPASDSGITVILTAYRRAEYLKEQIQALRNQTCPPKEIWVWSNRSEDELLDVSELADRVVASNTNWLFWGRFALANLVRTPYVAFFDDDILPQPKWFENCLATIEAGYDGILGGSGVLLPIEGGYSSKNKAGWNGSQLNQVVEVDLVGHAWFMRKKHVQYMWREEPRFWENGEDIHLSYMALKHGAIKTFVPPHPIDDMSLWSCRPDFGKAVGRLKVATYKTKDHRSTRSEIVDLYRQEGWEICATRGDVSQYRVKEFAAELEYFNRKLEKADPFSLVRFGDGELVVINGESIDLSEKCNGEHKYTPNDQNDEKYRKVLTESLLFKHSNYWVGIPCRCCVGDEHCDAIKTQSQQEEHYLTWANIFVNSNYPVFKEKTIALLSQRVVNIVCHQKANIDLLPFNIKKDFRVGANSWVNDYDRVLQELNDYMEAHRIENEVFLFCAGVLSNMLIYQLTQRFPNNTYLDVGSVFDDVMSLGQTRKYLKGSKRRLNKVCVW